MEAETRVVARRQRVAYASDSARDLGAENWGTPGVNWPVVEECGPAGPSIGREAVNKPGEVNGTRNDFQAAPSTTSSVENKARKTHHETQTIWKQRSINNGVRNG